MKDFLQIKSLDKKKQKEILESIEKIIAEKKKEGLFTDKEIQEISQMKLIPSPDIQDVQSVYEDFMYKKTGE